MPTHLNPPPARSLALIGFALAMAAPAIVSIGQTYRVAERPVRGAWLRPPSGNTADLTPHLNNLAAAGIEDLYIETFYHGLTTGHAGVFNARYSGDYLADAIRESARYGIRVHAWLESAYWQFGGTGAYNFTNHADWQVISTATGATGGDTAGQVFANLAHTGVQAKLHAYCAELAEYPGLWGIQTDYHRYPLDDSTSDLYTAPWSYDIWSRTAFRNVYPGINIDTAARKPGDSHWTQFLDWRREGISQAANQMHQGINSVDADIPFSAAMFARAMLDSAQLTKCQNWPSWASRGYVDWLVPMAYGSTSSSITSDINTTRTSASGKRVVAGLAIIAGTRPSITNQLNAIRSASVEDFIFFEGSILSDAAKRTETLNWINTTAKKAQADFNNDRVVDNRDWILFRSVYSGTPVSGNGPNARYNFDGDNDVDANDEARFVTEFIRDHFGDDGTVSAKDRAIFLDALAAGATGAPGFLHLYDLNADGSVNAPDLAILNLLAPPPPCAPDFNNDGFLDGFDYDDFVTCFETGSCPPGTSADYNNDAFVDGFDYDDFVTAFELGCP